MTTRNCSRCYIALYIYIERRPAMSMKGMGGSIISTKRNPSLTPTTSTLEVP
jgi:hypothetical protein